MINRHIIPAQGYASPHEHDGMALTVQEEGRAPMADLLTMQTIARVRARRVSRWRMPG